jgi:hypothetical protein
VSNLIGQGILPRPITAASWLAQNIVSYAAIGLSGAAAFLVASVVYFYPMQVVGLSALTIALSASYFVYRNRERPEVSAIRELASSQRIDRDMLTEVMQECRKVRQIMDEMQWSIARFNSSAMTSELAERVIAEAKADAASVAASIASTTTMSAQQGIDRKIRALEEAQRRLERRKDHE